VRLGLDRAGSGEPLVLLHGVGTTRRVWRLATPHLAGSHHVLAPDVPGFGDSPPVGPGFEIDAVVDVLAAELVRVAGRPFDLVGHSMGGALAVALASRHPDALHRLVLSAPAGFSPSPRAPALAAGALAPPVLGARRVLGERLAGSALARRAMLVGAVGDPAGMDAGTARHLMRGPLGARRLREAVTAIARADLRDELRSLDRGYALVWGARDRIIPMRVADRMATIREPVTLVRIPGAGHVAQLERPAEYAGAVRDALAAVTVS
jgi:pimeloyl-ACP methyl ester carboxylesterase